MGRMHKPEVDPKTKLVLPLELQDKRSVVPIEAADFDQWLEGTVEQAQMLLKLVPADVFDTFPAPPDPPREPKPKPERAQPKSPPAEPTLFERLIGQVSVSGQPGHLKALGVIPAN